MSILDTLTEETLGPMPPRAPPSSSRCSTRHLHPEVSSFQTTSYAQSTHLRTSRSPNAEEALAFLSMPMPPTKDLIEEACRRFLDMGVGSNGNGSVIIRSGALGACVGARSSPCRWVDALWTESDSGKVVDVTGSPSGLEPTKPRLTGSLFRCRQWFPGWVGSRPGVEQRGRVSRYTCHAA